MTASEQYLQSCRETLERISQTQLDAIGQAADLIAGRVASGGIVFTFGTGHSHELAEEISYRAGSVVPVNPILEPSLTGSTEVSKSEFLERLEGFAPHILDYHRVTKEDVLIIISNSGRNAVPVEMAVEARSRDIPVVAVTSLALLATDLVQAEQRQETLRGGRHCPRQLHPLRGCGGQPPRAPPTRRPSVHCCRRRLVALGYGWRS